MGLSFEQMQQLIGQAKQQYDAFKQKMAGVVVEAAAGGGMVSVRMNGEKNVLQVTIDPEVTRNDPDMLPDLIRAAVNEAGRQIDERIRAEMGGIAGLPLSGLF